MYLKYRYLSIHDLYRLRRWVSLPYRKGTVDQCIYPSP